MEENREGGMEGKNDYSHSALRRLDTASFPLLCEASSYNVGILVEPTLNLSIHLSVALFLLLFLSASFSVICSYIFDVFNAWQFVKHLLLLFRFLLSVRDKQLLPRSRTRMQSRQLETCHKRKNQDLKSSH